RASRPASAVCSTVCRTRCVTAPARVREACAAGALGRPRFAKEARGGGADAEAGLPGFPDRVQPCLLQSVRASLHPALLEFVSLARTGDIGVPRLAQKRVSGQQFVAMLLKLGRPFADLLVVADRALVIGHHPLHDLLLQAPAAGARRAV